MESRTFSTLNGWFLEPQITILTVRDAALSVQGCLFQSHGCSHGHRRSIGNYISHKVSIDLFWAPSGFKYRFLVHFVQGPVKTMFSIFGRNSPTKTSTWYSNVLDTNRDGIISLGLGLRGAVLGVFYTARISLGFNLDDTTSSSILSVNDTVRFIFIWVPSTF